MALEGLVLSRLRPPIEGSLNHLIGFVWRAGTILRWSVAALVISRAVLLLVGIGALFALPLTTGNGPWEGSPSQPALAALSRWDGRWYIEIAQDGYSYSPDVQSNVAFMPLYPVLMRVGGLVVGHTDTVAMAVIGVLLANAALLVALLYLLKLVSSSWDSSVAMRTILCLLAFPTSFYLSAIYPESLFVALAVAAFVYARQGRWWLVGILSGLAALTRTYGVLMLIPLVYEYGRQNSWRPGRQVLWLALAPAALAAWVGYLYLQFGDPLLMLHVQAAWERHPVMPWQSLSGYLSNPLVQSKTDILAVVLFAVLIARTWWMGARSLAIFSTLLYLATISSGIYSSFPRFSLELYPAFIVLGQLTGRKWVLVAYLVVGAGASAYLFARFATGGWVA